ncbi:MAG TPA: hypothetical protein VKS21_12565, partial [Spirochaetota bacterium]|nr:hypothetical protein [Spirochaetota bacterium]
YEFQYPASNNSSNFTAAGNLLTNGVFISNYNLSITSDTMREAAVITTNFFSNLNLLNSGLMIPYNKHIFFTGTDSNYSGGQWLNTGLTNSWKYYVFDTNAVITNTTNIYDSASYYTNHSGLSDPRETACLTNYYNEDLFTVNTATNYFDLITNFYFDLFDFEAVQAFDIYYTHTSNTNNGSLVDVIFTNISNTYDAYIWYQNDMFPDNYYVSNLALRQLSNTIIKKGYTNFTVTSNGFFTNNSQSFIQFTNSLDDLAVTNFTVFSNAVTNSTTLTNGLTNVSTNAVYMREITDITSNISTDLPENGCSLLIKVPEDTTTGTVFLIDKAGFNESIVNPESYVSGSAATTTQAVTNQALIRTKTLIGINSGTTIGYKWNSGLPDEEINVYLLENRYSFDGNGCWLITYNIEMWGGLAMLANVNFNNYDMLRFKIRGFFKDHNMLAGQNQVTDGDSGQAVPVINDYLKPDSDLRQATAEACRVLDAPVPLADSGGWETVDLDCRGTGNPYWLKIGLPSKKGGFMLDNIVLVDTNMWQDPPVDNTPLKIFDHYPKAGDLKDMDKDAALSILGSDERWDSPVSDIAGEADIDMENIENPNYLKILVNQKLTNLELSLGGDFNLTNAIRRNPAHYLDQKNGLYEYHLYDFVWLYPAAFSSGKKYTFTLTTNTVNQYGRRLAQNYSWDITPVTELLQNIELTRQILDSSSSGETGSAYLTFFSATEDTARLTIYLTDRNGVPVKRYRQDALYSSGRYKLLLIQPVDFRGDRLPPGVYILHIEEEYKPDNKHVVEKKTIYIK